MDLEDVVVNAGCTVIYGTTQNIVITKWTMDDVSWEFDVTTSLDLPDNGTLCVSITSLVMVKMIYDDTC